MIEIQNKYTILVLETQYFSCCLLHFIYLGIYLKTKKNKKKQNKEAKQRSKQNKTKKKRKGRREKEGPQQNMNPVLSGLPELS